MNTDPTVPEAATGPDVGGQPDWLAMVREATTADKWAKIIEEALNSAMGGDRYARDFIVSCVLPKNRDETASNTVKEVRIVLAKQ